MYRLVSAGLRVKEVKEVYEGEVTEMTPQETDNPLGGKLCAFGLSTASFNRLLLLGYGKTLSHVIIGLKTSKGTKQLKLDPSIHDTLMKQKIEVGDVIYIESNSGAVKVRS